jgi:ribosomal protein S18 acetylase RimI-like enzyme
MRNAVLNSRRPIEDRLERFAEIKRMHGLSGALVALLIGVGRTIYGDERHLILVKSLDEAPALEATDAFAVQPLETVADLERVAAGSHHYLVRQPVLANHLKNGYCAQLACATGGEPLGYLWCAARNTDDKHPDLVLHQIDLAEDEAYVFSLFVARSGRGERVAPALLRHTEAFLCERGYRRMVGWVDAKNRPARWFFATNGFEATETVRVRFVLSLLAFSRGRILLRNFGLLSSHSFGYRAVFPKRRGRAASVAKSEQ